MQWNITFVTVGALLILFYQAECQNVFDTQPRILSQNGHLLLISGRDRNITLKTSDHGYVNLNGENLAYIAKSAREAADTVRNMRTNVLNNMEQNVEQLMAFMSLYQERMMNVEKAITNRSTIANDPVNKKINALTRRVGMLERRARQLQNLLTTNECLSNPCQNGGTCIDSFNGYFCQCPKNWEGLLCNVDVNECSHFAGTDLGCQNGATCINRPGTYECVCASNWLGVHCTQRSDDCTSSSSVELCGHGTCVNTKASGGKAYKCICDQGWTTLGETGPCTVDVDECGSSSRPACSMNPVVQCVNVPGSFFCGSCPQGYTGNGYYCTDIDECQVNNGGCSVNPLVQCINTQGSRICGQCPPGYQGDGKFCTFLGVCSVNNGGCHPLARCVDNPRISQTYVECICPTGYLGSGMGPTGCVPGSGGGSVVPGGGGGSGQVSSNPCIGVQCVHGSCLSTSATTYMCLCLPGFTGNLCELAEDPCSRRPCQNGGTCTRDGISGFRCICADGYTGLECQEQQQSCGGTLTALSGTLQFPASGSLEYGHNLNCPWLIITNTSKVLQVNFTRFQLESSPQCEYDFLQIHDGRTSGAHMLGRYCGNKMPPNITSTHNKLYLWFRTDQSHSRGGFSLTWNSVDPVCGTALLSFTTHGRLQSPGSPGMYPNNRDCYWTLVAPYGRRIQFNFYTMQIEASANCSNDFLEIHAGFATGQILNRYCNTSHPRPLTTPGHVATLYFHTNDKRNDAGFQISYTSVESFPGCGGTLSAPSGEISSPNHPTTYRENIDCDWHIQMPHNERIHLTFLAFSLENSMGCFFDYLEIREGVEEDSPVIGRYCGTNLPPQYTSTRNELVIRFSSDYSLTGDGFRIKYESLCGGIFSEPSGVLTSPYYPNSYPASRTCIYEIALEPGKAVELCFQDFEVEDNFSPPCRYDYLQIRDGHNENATLIGEYCGGQDQFPTPCITSQYNYFWLKFVTDNSIHNRGFYANYSSIDVQCGGILKGETGTIQSPNYPLYYLHGQKCQWVIVGRPGTVVKLTWESFSLEGGGYTRTCLYDKIMVFDNSTIPGHGGLMGTFCGSNLPPVLTTTDNTMTIVFTTDNSGSREGFSATYTLIDVSTLCGGTFFSSKGSLQSPNYPNWYPHNKDCTYVINVPTGQQIKLNVTDFDLEGGTNCYFDFLEIRNGGTNLSPLIGKYCGTSIPRSIPSLSHQLYLHFKTDGSGRRTGFKITWDGSTTGCGGVLTAPSGSIISPNYPQPYGHSSECFWRISVSQGSAIQLVFVDLDLEGTMCYFDYLEVYDGRDTSAKKIGRYCSTSPLTIVSANNNLYLKFRSDPSIEGRGFHIRYETVCNRLVKGYSGVIESPNFPANYGESLDCTWNIMAPKGNKINVTFSHFSLESIAYLWYWHSSDDVQETCRYDYVEIKEGRGSSAPDTVLMSKKCGTDMPEHIHSSKDHVYVHFVSDESRSASGFRLEWIVNGCGGVLTKPTGTFSSPNYPWGYPKDTECEWLITVDWSHSIEVTIKNFSMENMRECFYDSLSLYSGTDDSGAMLHQFCHSNPQEETFTSSGNSLFVKFVTDFSFQGKGFTASYRQVPIRCGGKFTTASGTIHSPNYPQNYDVNEDCQWLIEVNPNYVVWFQFIDFDLSYSPDCQHTFVKIYDGNSTSNNTVLFHDCSNNMPSVTNFTSTGNQMLIHMRADSFLTAKGFRANFSIACGARIIAKDTGVISINNALNKEHNQNCSWIIIAENPEDHVTLTINIMDVTMYNEDDDDRCPWYFIELRDGQDVDAPLIGSYCGNRAPPHITTQGSAIFVHAVSRYLGHYGTFSATYSVLSSVCGGNMSSEHGSFASPGYPNSYPTESDCEWFISTSPGNRVMLTFSMFELELDDYCNEDYVEVRKGSGIGPLIGIYCGTDIPSNLTAASSLWIKFRSTGTGTAPGFVADYSLLHGNDLSGLSGQVASPLYPRPYQHEGLFHWRITVENSRAISITFSDFFIDSFSDECYYSFLAIYDGFDETGPLLSKSCGANIPASVTSSSNIIYIELSTGGYRLGAHFLLNWLQVERYISNPYPTSPPIPGCGGMINMEIGGNRTAEIYTLTSPGYPEGYDINLNCEWIFETTPSNHLSIYFQNMDLESTYNCYYDYVKVYTGVEGMPEWDPLSTVCLPNATYQRRIETTNLMKVVFRSDSYMNKTGFKASVRIECGGSLTGPNGVIDMRNESRALHWISRYSPLQCEWNVTVRTGKTILVNFIDFNIPSQDSNHCAESNIVLRNGISRNSPMLGQGRYCGNNPGTQFETSGNHLRISFKGLTSEAIFKLSYSEKSMSCGGHFSLSSENSSIVISSPNYPNIPQPHTECEWVFLAPAGERIHMDFLERFDITYSYECRQAFVELRDGGTISSLLIDKFCKEKPSSQYTTSNMLYVRYFTDVTDPKNGFKANISIDTCGGTYRGMQGLIRLPTYPGQYPNNLNCSWQIAGPPDHYLTIWFDELSMPYSSNCTGRDSVTVSEMQTQNVSVYEPFWRWRRMSYFPSRFPRFTEYMSPRLRSRSYQVTVDTPIVTYCGSRQDMTPPINSTMNEVNVRFQSFPRQISTLKRGFSLRYNVSQETCGGLIEGSSGIFQSPGYPSTTGYRRYCRWEIVVPVGRRVKVELLDFDLENSMVAYRHRLVFLDSLQYMIKVLYARDTPEVIRSSGNKMTVLFSSFHNVGHRGFKARFSSDELAMCGGDLNADSGFIQSPSKSLNLTRYSCEWERTIQGGLNKTFVISLVNGTFSNSCYYRANTVAVMTRNERYTPLAEFCSNYTGPNTLALPFMDIVIEASRVFTGDLDFTIRYSVSNCGGILSGPLDIVSSPMGANGKYPPNSACAWSVAYPEGSVVNVTFVKMKLHSNCDGDYLLIRNGPRLSSPLLNKYCGTNIPQSIISQSTNLWIEFYSDQSDEDEGFILRLEPVFEGCGGVLHTRGSVLKTPKFPDNYLPNTECLWDIRASDGYTISLKFIERFEIEASAECVNDFVEVFDYVNNEYTSLGRYCGRTNHPQTINSTSSQMRVLFRSNADKNGSGFKAVVDFLCGGIITKLDGRIISPGFPQQYDNYLQCNYTIIPPSQSTVQLEFADFDLEGGNLCYFDWVKIYEEYYWSTELQEKGTYCGTNTPPPMRGRKRIVISFKTDGSVRRRGFMINLSSDDCGSNLTSPAIIHSPRFMGNYLSEVNCRWNITAPAGKNIVLRFSEFIIEYNNMCRFDYVAVYDGNEINDTLKLGILCGNLTKSPPILHSTGNQMVVLFRTDYSGNYQGFRGSVTFQTACGGTIQLENTASLQPIVTSDPFLTCRWLVLTSRDKQIQFTLTSYTSVQCNNTTANNCSCSYIEVRDGPGSVSELMRRYCGGETLPLPVISSSSNQMWVSFVSESGIGGGSFQATVTAVTSICGSPILNVTSTVQEVTSPGYPSNYPPNIRCRWLLTSSSYGRYDLHFSDLDIEQSTDCTEDFLSIEGIPRSYDNRISEGLGDNLIFSGTITNSYHSLYNGMHYPAGKTTYCGNHLPLDYYTDYNNAQVTFKSNDAVQRKGFKLRYALAGCNRNYTSIQGRIYVDQLENECIITIQVPANRTIALYFLSFNLYSQGEQCADSSLEVRDGLTQGSTLLARLCGYERPNPIFSTGNTLRLHKSGSAHYGTIDITYTTNDQSRGCGGVLFNYGGVFTSPFYPNNYRNNSVCRWDVSVPVGTQLLLRFAVFDIGIKATCETDFVEIYDINSVTNEETFIAHYCGGDNPAMHEGSTGTVSVRYTTSIHNGGTGWVAVFMGKIPGSHVDPSLYW